jgi:outer membrane protein assembly factor BamB
MHTALKAVACAALAAAAGCSSLNPFASKPPPRNPPAALAEFKQAMAVRTGWTNSIGNSGAFVFTPAAAGSGVFVAAADGSVARLDPASGRTVWRVSAGMPLTAGVGSDGVTVAVAGEKGTVLAFDADGKERWRAQASSEILSAPAVGQGLVVVRSMDNRIVAFDADSGSRRWVVQRSTPALTLRGAPGIALADSTAYIGLTGGRLLALALSNGGPRWEVVVGDPRGTTELERIADISGAPVTWGREVCAVSYQGRLACFDAVSGAGRWAKNFSSEVGVSADQRFIFAADERGVLSAFTRDGGVSVWRNDKLANRRLSAPASFGRAVAVGDFEGYVHFLSREDGAFLARAATDGSPIVAAPQVVGSNLILQTRDGTVLALTGD